MALKRKKFLELKKNARIIQRVFRSMKMFKIFRDIKKIKQRQGALLLQRYMRGYLVSNKHRPRVAMILMQQEMDVILRRCEPMKQHSLVSLQIALVYLWKKKKERKRLAKIAEKKRKEAAKKAAEKEKKRLKLLKIKNKRKDKKRKYKTLLDEAVKIIYHKEEEKRELEFQKYKRKFPAKKHDKNKDVPVSDAWWSVAPMFFKTIYKGNEKKLEDWKERKKKEREALKKKKTIKSKDKGEKGDKANDTSALSDVSGLEAV